jgi:lysophospholipase L1-like esterase
LEVVMRRQNLWLKVLVLTNTVSLLFLAIISFHYQVPQKALNKLGIINLYRQYTYYDYRKTAINSIVNGEDSFEIAMVGDSITEAGDWNQLLGREDVANLGIGGDSTEKLPYRLYDIYLANPKKCFLMIGINDIRTLHFNNNSVEKIYENYKDIINNIRNHNIEVVVESTLNVSERMRTLKSDIIERDLKEINADVNQLNELLKVYCNEQNILYVDLNKEMTIDGFLENQYTYDGLHLGEKGLKKWRDIILPYL